MMKKMMMKMHNKLIINLYLMMQKKNFKDKKK